MMDADGVDGSATELADADVCELLALERHRRATEFTAQGLLAEFALENWAAFGHFAEQHGHAATALRDRWISGWSEEFRLGVAIKRVLGLANEGDVLRVGDISRALALIELVQRDVQSLAAHTATSSKLSRRLQETGLAQIKGRLNLRRRPDKDARTFDDLPTGGNS